MTGVRVGDTILEVCPRCYGSGERRYAPAPRVAPVAEIPGVVPCVIVVCCDRCNGNGITNALEGSRRVGGVE
jgi:hypothetical protein